MEYNIKKDCFAYDKRTYICDALDRLYCKHEECRFHKTKEQNNHEELHARNNIKNKFWKDMYL